MNYSDALNWLNQFITFANKTPDIYKPENVMPDRSHRLLARQNNPHLAYPTMHVAGSKGKGSVAALCAYCLRSAGLQVGLYTSPHLQDMRERIRILTPTDSEGLITKEQFAHHATELKPIAPMVAGVTWFDLMTVIAFSHFAQQKVDVAVIEVGLGGRLDSTNVLTPLVTVITTISYEHTALLGETLAEIALEKAGIMQPFVPAISSPQTPEAITAIRGKAAHLSAPLAVIGEDVTFVPLQKHTLHYSDSFSPPLPTEGVRFDINLLGQHQLENTAVVVAALRQIMSHFPTLTLDTIRQGLAETVWRGRMQLLRAPSAENAGILVDGAHNSDSAQRLAIGLKEYVNYNKLWLLLGMSLDKDAGGIIQALAPLAAGIVVTPSTHPRTMTAADVAKFAKEIGVEVAVAADVNAGISTLLKTAAPGDLICATGSLFIVGDLLNHWERLQSQAVA